MQKLCLHYLFTESNLGSDIGDIIENGQNMNGGNKTPVYVSHSNPPNYFDRIDENGSKECNLDDESRDTLPPNDTFSPNDKEAQKNRERFAITKSYSIEVNMVWDIPI